jgi:hypothetical protein
MSIKMRGIPRTLHKRYESVLKYWPYTFMLVFLVRYLRWGQALIKSAPGLFLTHYSARHP